MIADKICMWLKGHDVNVISLTRFFILPVQDNPSPVNPALHVQMKEPMVFWQTALTSQGEERHSLISVKYKRLRLKKENNISNNNKGPLGLPFLNFYQTDPRLAVRGADIIRSLRGKPLRCPLRKAWIAPLPPPPGMHNMMQVPW